MSGPGAWIGQSQAPPNFSSADMEREWKRLVAGDRW